MATGDIVWFDEALEIGTFMAGWAGTDDIKCAICDDTATPIAGFATPTLGDFTEVGSAGSYVAGGTSLGDWTTIWTEVAGTAKLDSGTDPSWAKNASNDTDAYWGILYNDTQGTDPAFAFVDLGGPVNMTAGDLTIAWNASGIATLVKV